MVFCPLLKKSSLNPYLKILDFPQLFVTETPTVMDTTVKFPPSHSTFGIPSTKRIDLRFSEPHWTNTKWNNLFPIWNVRNQNRVKNVHKFMDWNFLERSNLRPLSGINLKIYFAKKIVVYVHLEFPPTNFQENWRGKGGGVFLLYHNDNLIINLITFYL